MALLRLLLTSALALSFAGAVLAGEHPVQAEADLAGHVVAVGDTFRLNIDVTWDDSVSVKPLALGENIGDFAVRDISYGPTVADGAVLRRRTSLLLTVFETGEKTVPPIAVVYLDEAGKAGKAETRPLSIEVESVLEEDASDIKDIKGPLDVPRRWKDLILSWSLLVGLGLAAATSVLVSVKRREDLEAALRRAWLRVAGPLVRLVHWVLMRLSLIGRDEYGAPALDSRMAEPYLTPEQAAMKDFDLIEEMGLVGQGLVGQYYTLVSEAVRRYLERRYRVLAMESPSSQTLEDMGRKDVAPEALGLLGSLLEETDLVKFAKFEPDQEAVRTLVDRGRRLVDMTGRPQVGWPTGEEEVK